MPAHVLCTDEQDAVPIDCARWERLASAVLEAEMVAGELTLTFVDAAEIAALNAEYMGVEGPTDVLSFPMDDPHQAVETSAPTGGAESVPVLLGDVVICPEVAARAAADHAGTLVDEIALLIVHGILHVLGHDHDIAERTAVMQARELAHLERSHWGGPAPAGFSLVHRDGSDPH